MTDQSGHKDRVEFVAGWRYVADGHHPPTVSVKVARLTPNSRAWNEALEAKRAQR